MKHVSISFIKEVALKYDRSSLEILGSRKFGWNLLISGSLSMTGFLDLVSLLLEEQELDTSKESSKISLHEEEELE